MLILTAVSIHGYRVAGGQLAPIQLIVDGPFVGAMTENAYLQSQAQFLKAQLGEVEKRLQQLEEKDAQNGN